MVTLTLTNVMLWYVSSQTFSLTSLINVEDSVDDLPPLRRGGARARGRGGVVVAEWRT
jgi:hypothetical protein